MARPKAEKIGRGRCIVCGEAVTYRKSAGGHIKCECDACDVSLYAPPGSKAYNMAAATITREPEATDAPPAAPAPAPNAPQPAAAVATSFWERL